ncbi:kynureninase [Acinetobacter oleivorans]|uniref:kynureninase n=1 Tax=Acinetobacter oleivorans TaxID=1148157 RepID=UPI00190075FF|nr:kynureninase [Acinetobacter oleivorans]MBJ9739615.1 kynureninase [Acinetobacter oleivorans]MCU4411977.1 kynureninase [Acinetobacter oleivorans]
MLNLEDINSIVKSKSLLKENLKSSFDLPLRPDGAPYVYLSGHSLGPLPRLAREFINNELDCWAKYGVRGHFKDGENWVNATRPLVASLSRLVGASVDEVAVMNGLTVNLHLMLTSFYIPKKQRCKILVAEDAFPSDIFAVKSQIALRGLDPAECLIQVKNSRIGSFSEAVVDVIKQQGEEIAVLLLEGVNYLTGEVLDIENICKVAHAYGIVVGLDLAHAIGNIPLNLQNWKVDFAVWCSYKYLNSGPGGIGGCYVHKNHHNSVFSRCEGWWGCSIEARFSNAKFYPDLGANGWQLSNPPIFQIAALRASLKIFDETQFTNLRNQSINLVSFAKKELENYLENKALIITPSNSERCGNQISIRLKHNDLDIEETLFNRGIICDWRAPDIMRVSFNPLYNDFSDINEFVYQLAEVI